MNGPARVAVLEVYKDDRLAGRLERTDRGSRFVYDPEYLASGGGPIARHLGVAREPIETVGVANLHSYFAGLLPEGVMLDIVQRRIRASRDDLFSILAATGSDAIGDVTVRQPGSPPAEVLSLDRVDLQALVEARSAPSVAAIPGVQPKLSIGALVRVARVRGRRKAYIAKVPPADLPGLIENEAFFMRAARRCGLRSADVATRQGCLLVTRFDRVVEEGRQGLRQLHVEDALQLADRYPAAKYDPDYREIGDLFHGITGSKAVVLNLLELYAFSYLIGNGDLHAKNVSLMLGAGTDRWNLTPAYDLLSTLPYGDVLWGADRMALALEGESFGRFLAEDFVRFGQRYAVPETATRSSLRRIASKASLWLPDLDSLPYPEAVVAKMRETIADRARALLA
ncbi:MAG: HipA domain-containing protein [Fimbriimonadaceae bacterium]|nr:HipA domain-containing protein [Fimbriimonadaceae bacterium]